MTHVEHIAGHDPEGTPLSNQLICWSRMQSEAGQGLNKILARKENERTAGDGLFFWGVGNAPSKAIPALVRLKREIPVYFSVMKSKPKLLDSAPSSVVIWRRYIDIHGAERPLPPFALITSRGHSEMGIRKTRHFALVCRSERRLELSRGIPFDHHMYRNAGPNGGQIGASQVTALLARERSAEKGKAQYEVNLEATLSGNFWVRLADPLALPEPQIELIEQVKPVGRREWIEFVSELRQHNQAPVEFESQLAFF